MSDRPRWEPETGWSVPATEAFLIYRDLGATRSTAAVAKLLGKTKALIDRWSSKHGWVERAAAYDHELDRQHIEEFTAGRARAAYKQGTAAAAYIEALAEPAKAMVAKIRDLRAQGKDPFAGMTVVELLRLLGPASRALANAQQVQRLALGLSTENVAGHDGGPLSLNVEEMSQDAIDAYLTGRRDAEREAAKQPTKETAQ